MMKLFYLKVLILLFLFSCRDKCDKVVKGKDEKMYSTDTFYRDFVNLAGKTSRMNFVFHFQTAIPIHRTVSSGWMNSYRNTDINGLHFKKTEFFISKSSFTTLLGMSNNSWDKVNIYFVQLASNDNAIRLAFEINSSCRLLENNGSLTNISESTLSQYRTNYEGGFLTNINNILSTQNGQTKSINFPLSDFININDMLSFLQLQNEFNGCKIFLALVDESVGAMPPNKSKIESLYQNNQNNLTLVFRPVYISGNPIFINDYDISDICPPTNCP